MVNQTSYLLSEGIEVITLSGTLQVAPYRDVKAVCFTTEAPSESLFAASSLFERRPKVPGLWTRFTFRDGDRLDGILSHNLLEWPTAGYLLVPPRASSARGRVFVPRDALLATELRGVVGASSPTQRATAGKKPTGDANQLSIFES